MRHLLLGEWVGELGGVLGLCCAVCGWLWWCFMAWYMIYIGKDGEVRKNIK